MSHKKPNRVVRNLYENSVRGSEKDAIVTDRIVVLCLLTKTVQNFLGIGAGKVHLNARVLKHVYDKRPAEEFDFLLDNLFSVVKYPDKIYLNKSGKRGEKCFTKKMRGKNHFVSFEIVDEGIQIVTMFRPAENYLKSYEQLWSWEERQTSS